MKHSYIYIQQDRKVSTFIAAFFHQQKQGCSYTTIIQLVKCKILCVPLERIFSDLKHSVLF